MRNVKSKGMPAVLLLLCLVLSACACAPEDESRPSASPTGEATGPAASKPGGSDGSNGRNGSNGSNGSSGSNGSDGSTGSNGSDGNAGSGPGPGTGTAPGSASAGGGKHGRHGKHGKRTPTQSRAQADYLLAQQIRLLEAGGGSGPTDCAADLSRFPDNSRNSPAAWLTSDYGLGERELADEVALCLHGFTDKRPIMVNVTVGGRNYGLKVTPVPNASPASGGLQGTNSPASLFNGATLSAYHAGEGVMQSRDWLFVPPSPVRERIAAAGALRITAVQGAVVASRVQPVDLPHEHARMWLYVKGKELRHLVVYGFGKGERVPVGLFAEDRPLHAVLVRQIGTVVIPASRVAVFTMPRDVLALRPKTKYCVTVPLPSQLGDCFLG